MIQRWTTFDLTFLWHINPRTLKLNIASLTFKPLFICDGGPTLVLFGCCSLYKYHRDWMSPSVAVQCSHFTMIGVWGAVAGVESRLWRTWLGVGFGFGKCDWVLLCCVFIQSDSHPGQRWSSQYSQCRPGDHAPDPDCCGPPNTRHQSAGCCWLAAVSLTCTLIAPFASTFFMHLAFPHLIKYAKPSCWILSPQGSIQDLGERGGWLLRCRHRVPHVQGRAWRAGCSRG